MSDNHDDPFDDDLDFGDGEVELVSGDVNEPGADGNGPAEQNDTPAEVVSTEVVSTEVEEKAEEKAKAEAEAEEKAKAEAEAELKEKLEAFESTVGDALASEDWDNVTGTLPEAIQQKVVASYAELPGAKGKTAAKKWLESQMQAMMVAGSEDPANYLRARTYMDLNNLVTASRANRGEGVGRAKVDPTEAFVQRIAAMMLAPSLVTVPDDVNADWAEKAQALAESAEQDVAKYQDYVLRASKGEIGEDEKEPEVNPVVVAAARIAAGRATGGRGRPASTTPRAPRATGTGHSGDIGEHVRQAFENVQVGTFLSIADIAKFESTEYNTDGKPAPSQGAISARLFPGKDPSKCNLTFIRPEGKEEGRDKKGAVKIS